MKKFLLAMIVSLVVIFLMGSVGQAFVLDGNVLTVGVDNSGGLVDLAAPPAFPGDNGQGITYKPVGTNDFTGPGTPFEFYSLGVNGAVDVGGVPGFAASNPFGLTTVDNSAGTTKQADSSGPNFALGGTLLNYSQTVTFDTNGNVITFTVDINNVGTSDAPDVVYARGLDPDQDVGLFNSFVTTNTFPGPGSVLAVGPLTGLYIRIDDLTGGGIASISGEFPDGPWETDPYVLAGGGLVNGAVAGNPLDYSINMAWNVGDIPAGESADLSWTYTVSSVPEPSSMLMLGCGLLALVGWRRFSKS